MPQTYKLFSLKKICVLNIFDLGLPKLLKNKKHENTNPTPIIWL
jgi:hypothetical protein